MMDDIRVDFRKLNGHWFVSVGSKGYACTSEFEEKLNEWNPRRMYISETPRENPWFLVQTYERGKDIVTKFIDVSGHTSYDIRQCSKIIDLQLPPRFYISHGNS